MKSHPHIQVAICTCKRPAMLADCLNSVLSTQLPENYTVSVAVIDNDAEQSAKTHTESIQAAAPFPISYLHEPRRGIPVARNKALDHAIKHQIDYLAFIDDDEQVAEDWLITLVAYEEDKGGQAVIHGKVVSQCPEGTPRYLVPFFTKKTWPTGTKLDTCATDNVVFPLKPVADHGIRFDETHPLSGGTDTQFFSIAYGHGIPIYSCLEAIVHETIPCSKATLQWLARRKYRIALGKVRRGVYADMDSSEIIRNSVLRCIRKSLSAFLYVLMGRREKAAKTWLKVCQSAGTISGFMGLRYDEYSTIHGS